MLLIVDIGNSYTKFKIKESSFYFSLKTSIYNDVEELKKCFPIEKNNSITDAIISSVCLNKDEIIKEFLINEYNVTPIIINHNLKYDIKYPALNELGSDLISLMEGASIYSNTHLTISLGTATVFNLVIDNNYIGTAISPGIFTSLNGLIDSASMISISNSPSKNWSLKSFFFVIPLFFVYFATLNN